MNHACDRTDSIECVHAEHRLRNVRHANCDHITFFYAESYKSRSCLIDFFNKNGVAECFAHEGNCRKILFLFCRLQHRIRNAHIRILKVKMNVTVICKPRCALFQQVHLIVLHIIPFDFWEKSKYAATHGGQYAHFLFCVIVRPLCRCSVVVCVCSELNRSLNRQIKQFRLAEQFF